MAEAHGAGSGAGPPPAPPAAARSPGAAGPGSWGCPPLLAAPAPSHQGLQRRLVSRPRLAAPQDLSSGQVAPRPPRRGPPPLPRAVGERLGQFGGASCLPACGPRTDAGPEIPGRGRGVSSAAGAGTTWDKAVPTGTGTGRGISRQGQGQPQQALPAGSACGWRRSASSGAGRGVARPRPPCPPAPSVSSPCLRRSSSAWAPPARRFCTSFQS